MRVISQFTLQLHWAYYVYNSLETHTVKVETHTVLKVEFYCQVEVRTYLGLTWESGLGKDKGRRLPCVPQLKL